jgi:hypothetical protein
MHARLIQAGKIARRVPFTLVMVAILTAFALITDSVRAEISAEWVQRLGFAPQDFWLLNWGRMVSSALVTTGGRLFWASIAMILVAVGGAEWLSGTLRTVLTFWGGHLAGLIIVSVVLVLPAVQTAFPDVPGMYTARDVGSSVGFVCCMGLLSARLPGRWRWIVGIPFLVALVILVFLPPPAGRDRSVYLSSALAHLAVFPLGWVSSGIGRRAHPHRTTGAGTPPA